MCEGMKATNVTSANSSAITIARLALAGLTENERTALLGELKPQKSERILSREEVARLFGRTLRCVDNWARRGQLRRVRLPGMTRGVGFLESEVLNLLRGEGTR